MPKLVLFALGILAVLIFSRKVRRIVFHIHVRRFVMILVMVSVLAFIVFAGYLAWKFWLPIYMAKPTVEYHDETLEEDPNPVTPGVGGKPQPVIIQTR